MPTKLFLFGSLMFGSTGTLLLAQLPGVPDDLKAWPVTAILGLVTLSSLGLCVYTIKSASSYLVKLATHMATLTEQDAGRARLHAETNAKIGETNRLFSEFIGELRAEKSAREKAEKRTEG